MARPELQWIEEDVTKGVRHRRFDVRRDRRLVPGILMTPDGASGERPLVLLGHGAGNTKRSPHILAMGRRLVRHHSFAAVAIDGPTHGDRRSDGAIDTALMALEFAAMWANDPRIADDMVSDWRATLDLLQQLDDVGQGKVGYWGLSMGTIFGVPLVGAEKRIEVAVLGLMGTAAPNAEFRSAFVSSARSISCPVLFLLQWDDEIMKRQDVLALFGEIGSTDKRLHAHPGRHVAVPLEEFEFSERFLAARIGPELRT